MLFRSRAELDLAEFVPAEAEFSAAGSGLRLDCRVEDELWVVAADPGQVAQVIQNLVLNSIQATGGTGSIEISLRNVEEVDTPSAARTKCYVEMTFADDGPGIPPEIQGRIFDPYFSTKGSSGLGLATVYSIVERHGGSMTLESSEDRGTTFNKIGRAHV